MPYNTTKPNLTKIAKQFLNVIRLEFQKKILVNEITKTSLVERESNFVSRFCSLFFYSTTLRRQQRISCFLHEDQRKVTWLYSLYACANFLTIKTSQKHDVNEYTLSKNYKTLQMFKKKNCEISWKMSLFFHKYFQVILSIFCVVVNFYFILNFRRKIWTIGNPVIIKTVQKSVVFNKTLSIENFTDKILFIEKMINLMAELFTFET